MSPLRAALLAVLLVLLIPVIGMMLLYAYRAQSPGGPIDGPMVGIAVLPMLLMWLVPVAVIFLIVYAAVRLAIRHERGTPGG